MLIDTHTHLSNMLGFIMTEEMIKEMMEKYNIDYCIVSNADAVEYDHDLNPIPISMQFPQNECFERTIKFARSMPGKIGVMPWVKPTTETADEILEQMIKDNLDIVKGVKAHPYHSKMSFDADEMIPFIELAEKYDLPVLIHTGGCDEAAPVRVYNMAVRYPKVNFIMGHMGLGTDNKEAAQLMGKADNLYADTAWVPVETTKDIIRKYGSGRVMFGTDSPIDGVDTYKCNPKGEPSMYVPYFETLESEIGTEAYEDLMWRTAARLFKISL